MHKKFNMILDDTDHRRLKSMAAAHGLSLGGMIRALLDFSGSYQYIKDDAFQGRFVELLKAEIMSAGGKVDAAPTVTFWPSEDGSKVERYKSFDVQ